MQKKIFILGAAFLCLIISNSWARLVTPYNERICRTNSDISCIVVEKGDTWASLWPDPEQRNIAMRLNRMNIHLRKGMLLVDPDDLSQAQIAAFSPFPNTMQTDGQKVIVVSPKDLAWGAYDETGTLQKWGPASTARGFCSDIGSSCITPRGTFTVYRKEGDWCESSKFPVPYGGAPMPYCMFFKGGFALHGSDELPGYNASHGCVRMLVSDAQWLNDQFVEIGVTKVVIRD